MNVSRQMVNGHAEVEAVSVTSVPDSGSSVPGPRSETSLVCVTSVSAAAHITNGSLTTPSPRAPTSAGDVHEEFFGDDPLPDHDWELRNLYIPEIPVDLSANELRHVMATFGHVEDVQLIRDGVTGQSVAGHVVFRLADEAECAKNALCGQESLATLRELTPMHQPSGDATHSHVGPLEPQEADAAESKTVTEEGCPPEDAVEGASVLPSVQQQENQQQNQQQQNQQQQQHQQASRVFPRYHVPQSNYGRSMIPLPFMVPPAQAAAPWGGGSLYYPMTPAALHHIYGALPTHANYLAMAPAAPAPVNTAAHHRKSHRGADDNDGPCVRLVVHTRLVGK